MHAPSEVSRAGMATTSRRRRRVSSSRASARARPMWPWLARAAYDAVSTPRPSVRTRKSVTSSTEGVASTTSRVRDRIVGRTSSTVGAHSSHTVRSVGSSIALRRAFAAWSVSRSASSTTITCQRLPTGASAELRTRSRTSSTPMESFSVRVTRTSGCDPTAISWHEWHTPHPPCSHCSPAAKAIAALDRPDPGGPVNNQACDMSPATARWSRSMTARWPTRPSQTVRVSSTDVTGVPLAAAR